MILSTCQSIEEYFSNLRYKYRSKIFGYSFEKLVAEAEKLDSIIASVKSSKSDEFESMFCKIKFNQENKLKELKICYNECGKISLDRSKNNVAPVNFIKKNIINMTTNQLVDYKLAAVKELDRVYNTDTNFWFSADSEEYRIIISSTAKVEELQAIINQCNKSLDSRHKSRGYSVKERWGGKVGDGCSSTTTPQYSGSGYRICRCTKLA